MGLLQAPKGDTKKGLRMTMECLHPKRSRGSVEEEQLSRRTCARYPFEEIS